MNNFIETMKEQFIFDSNVTCLIKESSLEQWLNTETSVLMYVVKDEETDKVLSLEFVGV